LLSLSIVVILGIKIPEFVDETSKIADGSDGVLVVLIATPLCEKHRAVKSVMLNVKC